jgi:hypothetical protein
VPRWFALFIGVYLANTILPLHITHGQTRREFSIQAVVFIVLFAAALAVLITLGFLLEAGLYRLAEWPHDLSENHIFTSVRQIPLIFIEYWLVLALWTAGGAFIAAGFYRSESLGALTIPLAMVPAAIAEIAYGSSWGPLTFVLERVADSSGKSLALALPLGAASIALMLAMTWPIVRDIPIRPKKS